MSTAHSPLLFRTSPLLATLLVFVHEETPLAGVIE